MVIHTEDLTRQYGRKVANDKVCLRVGRGHIFGFLGPNGAGKSTFVKMMVGLIEPTSGYAEMLGRPLGDRAARGHVGFLPEGFRYQEWLNPMELLAFHGRLLGMETTDIRESSLRVLPEVGLAGEEHVKIRAFSKGMQQRLGLACALMNDPELLFLDEPTSALDPLGRRDVRELLVKLRERGTSVFLNSHLLSEIEMVCDEVAVIDHGHVVEAGPLDELLRGQCEVELSLAEPFTAAEALFSGNGFKLVEASRDSLVVGLAGEDRIPALVERVVQLGARVLEVRRRRRTLESLFLESVGGGEHV